MMLAEGPVPVLGGHELMILFLQVGLLLTLAVLLGPSITACSGQEQPRPAHRDRHGHQGATRDRSDIPTAW